MNNFQLLKRPRPLPKFKDEEQGIHAQWDIKGYYYKKNSVPKFSIYGKAKVQYASLVISGRFPKCQLKIPLVELGYIEAEKEILDIRGCNFRVLLFGVDNTSVIRDWLRFLVIRQRVPHSLMGKPFEWQIQPIKDDKQLKISCISPLLCFKFW